MDVETYLSRIGCEMPRTIDLATLTELHLAHLRTVPFENLDIHWGREIVLDEAHLYEKIVERRRGGICYELNGLFAWLLRALGFDVTVLAANVYSGDADLTPDFDHMVLLVNIGWQRYLADVGFGDSFLTPLALGHPGAQSDGASAYEISRTDPFYDLFRVDASGSGGARKPLFRFDLTPRSLHDFVDRCGFHQNSPESHFRRKTVCSRAHPEGRFTVSAGELIITGKGTRVVTELAGPEHVNAALQDYFGVIR
jgi:N-hydroxyarylamine O-acetyltransferase